jgi:hypothetical protein
MGGACSTKWGAKKHGQVLPENLKGIDNSEQIGVDGRIILKWI